MYRIKTEQFELYKGVIFASLESRAGAGAHWHAYIENTISVMGAVL